MHPGRALIRQAQEEPLAILCCFLNGGRSAPRDMFPIARGWIAMERDPDGFGRLKNHRLSNLKILGEGDGPATDTEPCQEDECAECRSHAFFLTEPVRNTKDDRTLCGGDLCFEPTEAKAEAEHRGLRRVCDNEAHDV